ncbi:MAG: sugar phosphate isomerase/epimerase [Bryobacteraceae bacterium]
MLKKAAWALPVAALVNVVGSEPNAVRIGVQSYSFRDRPLDAALDAMARLSLTCCELSQAHVEPKGLSREEYRQWRLSTPLEQFRQIRQKFDAAGIEIFAYNYSFREDFTDAEVNRGFEFARALGVNRITASTTVSTARRIGPEASKQKIHVAVHNHSNIKPDEFARPEDFEAAMKGNSKYIMVNLDIGHFTAAGFDAVAFLEQHHGRIMNLHLKDRKRNQGPNMAWGQGDTPIREVLQLLQKKGYDIPALIEYEHKGAGDSFDEVKKCLEYCRAALI